MSRDIDHFHEHRYEIWQKLRKHLADADHWDGDPIRINHPPFEIMLDVHTDLAGLASQVTTRLRAPFFNKEGFRFQIIPSTWSAEIACLLGAQDVEIGDPELDDPFILRTNNETGLKRLLNSKEIRREMIDSPFARLEVKDNEGMFGPDFPPGVDELYLEADGRITEIDQLERFYELFADVLDRLCQIGSAYKDAPSVTLD